MKFRHVDEAAFGGAVIRERIGQVAGVAFAPEAVLHQVHPLDQGIRIELGGHQFVQLAKRFLKFRMIVARLDRIETLATTLDLADLGERYAVVQEIGQRDLGRLDFGIGELHAEADAQSALFGGVEGEFPDGV